MSRAIAIDGPAASGKSSAAKVLAKKLGLVMVNSGAMYRAMTWKVLDMGVNPHDASAVVEALPKMDLECGIDSTGMFSTVSFDGQTLNDELRSEEVNNTVSVIAAIPELRQVLLKKQNAYLETHYVVMEGRDIGTVVFPDTPYKFFFEASERIRQARREAEGVTDSVAERDKQDSSRETAPLKPAEDSIIINTGDYDLEGVVECVIDHLQGLGWK